LKTPIPNPIPDISIRPLMSVVMISRYAQATNVITNMSDRERARLLCSRYLTIDAMLEGLLGEVATTASKLPVENLSWITGRWKC